ncbi:MAG: hypothetical protein ABIU09_12395 [Pyrinomonadaceae bacterium]
MDFKDCISLSLLSAAFNKSFPHFRKQAETGDVQDNSEIGRETVFRTLKDFSTAFPHTVWTDKESI